MENTVKATCQVCGRAIGAGKGVIAHHGYKRSYGWQSASCEGARYLPFEVSCERLGEVIEMIRAFIATQEKEYADFLATPPQTLEVEEKVSAWGKPELKVYERPENFDPSKYCSYFRTYGAAYATKRYKYEQTIKAAKADLSTMQRRLNEWKPASPKA